MSFDNVVFPLSVAKFSATIEYNTTILVMDGGAEARNANWDDARLSFDAASGVKTTLDLATMIAFFRARKGSARGFLVKDWTDYQITNQAIGYASSTTAPVSLQLIKSYSDAGNTENRIITKPKQGTLVARQNGSVMTEGLLFTMDYTTGILTTINGTVPANALITVDCEFYVPCRFLEDKLRADLILFKLTTGLGEMPQVPIIEVRDF